jgi:non-ribosomal peptide synthetase component E (peptide arylation enzyme)
MPSNARFPIEGVAYVPEAEAQRYQANGDWAALPAGESLRAAARRFPDKPALVSSGSRLSFRDWDEASERLGAALLGLGLEPSDRVLFQMGTIAETAIALYACFKAGLIPVCALPQHREIEIGDLSARSEARAHLVQADFGKFDLVAFAKTMAAGQRAMKHIIVARGEAPEGTLAFGALIARVSLPEARDRLAAVAIDIADVLAFQLSGGTTGAPKIIPRFHGEYVGYASHWARRLGLTERDVLLWALPLIHNAGQGSMLIPAVLAGATVVLMQRMDAKTFFEWIESERVSVAISIGPIAAHVLEYRDLARHDSSSLRLFMSLSRAGSLEAHLGVPCMNFFGITEGVLMASEPDAPSAARLGTVGRPAAASDEVKLLEPGGEREVPFGEPGELVFRGPSTTRGYYRMPEINRSSFTAAGFFRTGDVMRARRLGGRVYYAFEGRLKDNIDRGGEKFGAEEIENVIARHPGVADVKVVAMPDRRYGEKVCAYLIMRSGHSLPSVAELGLFLRAHGLAKFKWPERIESIGAFPVTRVGKVDKAALRAIVAEKMR